MAPPKELDKDVFNEQMMLRYLQEYEDLKGPKVDVTAVKNGTQEKAMAQVTQDAGLNGIRHTWQRNDGTLQKVLEKRFLAAYNDQHHIHLDVNDPEQLVQAQAVAYQDMLRQKYYRKPGWDNVMDPIVADQSRDKDEDVSTKKLRQMKLRFLQENGDLKGAKVEPTGESDAATDAAVASISKQAKIGWVTDLITDRNDKAINDRFMATYDKVYNAQHPNGKIHWTTSDPGRLEQVEKELVAKSKNQPNDLQDIKASILSVPSDAELVILNNQFTKGSTHHRDPETLSDMTEQERVEMVRAYQAMSNKDLKTSLAVTGHMDGATRKALAAQDKAAAALYGTDPQAYAAREADKHHDILAQARNVAQPINHTGYLTEVSGSHKPATIDDISKGLKDFKQPVLAANQSEVKLQNVGKGTETDKTRKLT